jgi:hypothetical protein
VPRVVPAIAAAFLLLLLQAVPAQAGFAAGNDPILAGVAFPELSSIATDSQGDSLVAWSEGTTPEGPPLAPRARWISAEGQLGPVIDLALGGTGEGPTVAMAPSGRAFVAWRTVSSGEPNGAVGRWVERDGTLGQLISFAPPAEGELDVAELRVVVDPAGVATVVMRNQAPGYSNEVAMRRVQPDGTAGPLVPKVGAGIEIAAAALPDGSTLLATRSAGIQTSVLSPDLQISSAQASSGNAAFGPGLAVDSLGNALVAWRDGNGPPNSVRARRLAAGGAPVGDELLVKPEVPALIFTPIEVSADSADDFLVAWATEAPGGALAESRALNSSGAFSGPVETLSASGIQASGPVAAINDSGSGAVVWAGIMGMASERTLGRALGPAGVPSGEIVELLDQERGLVAAGAPALGFAAFAVGHADGIVVRRFMDPPACGASAVTYRRQRPILVPLACTGAAIESGAVLSGPRRGKLGAIDGPGLSIRYTPQGGNDGFEYSLANDGGASTAARVTIKDRAKPKVKRLRLVRKKGRLRFVVRLSEPAKLQIAVKRRGRKGRRVGGLRSRKPGRKAVLKVRPKLAKRLLAGGRFRAVAVAVDRAGNKSAPKRLKFKIPR